MMGFRRRALAACSFLIASGILVGTSRQADAKPSRPVEAGVQTEKPGTSAVSPSLENTHWKLAQLGSKEVPAQSPAPDLMLASASKRVSGFSGCNRFMGGYRLDGKQITFDKIAATRMACVKGQEV